MFTLLIQLFFVSDYLRLPFSSQHWVFTFPFAVLGNIGVRWAAGLGFDGWKPVACVILAISTASILAILAGTVRDVAGWLRRRAGRTPGAAGTSEGPGHTPGARNSHADEAS